MHELTLCKAIATTATEHAAGRPLTRVTLSVGYLRQVVPETLEYCWVMTTQGSDLAGCELVTNHIPAVVACPDCEAQTTLTEPIVRCGSCGSPVVMLVSGDEFLVESIDLVAERH